MRLVTFAKRPRAVPLAADAKQAPVIERHGPGLGGATDIASALQLAYGLYPEGYIRHAVMLSDGVQTDGDLLAEANRCPPLRREALRRPLQAPRARRGRRPRPPRADHIHEGETFDIHAQVFSSVPQKVKLVLKQGDLTGDGALVRDGVELHAVEPAGGPRRAGPRRSARRRRGHGAAQVPPGKRPYASCRAPRCRSRPETGP